MSSEVAPSAASEEMTCLHCGPGTLMVFLSEVVIEVIG